MERGLPADTVLDDIQVEIEGKMVDSERSVTLELARSLGKGKRAHGGLSGASLCAGAARVETVFVGHRAGAELHTNARTSQQHCRRGAAALQTSLRPWNSQLRSLHAAPHEPGGRRYHRPAWLRRGRCGHLGGGDSGVVDGTLSDGSSHQDSTVVSLSHGDAGATDGQCSTKVTCASAGAECGPISNGCGGVLQCGGCPPGKTCGGGGKASVCGTRCVPTTCVALGYNCGPAGDGCGNPLDCGKCSGGETCGGGGKASVCGTASSCTPTTCAAQGYNCGPAGDGCGNPLDCGTCTLPETCGGAGPSSVCGTPTCTPLSCATGQCGPVADGCGGLLQCGGCSLPETCGGVTPSECGVPVWCTGLCLQQQSCSNPADTTTVSGTVYAPNGADPLPNVLVYIPNAPVDPFTPGVACETCSSGVSGSPLVSAATDTSGNFTLQNVPVGTGIPLVIQTGRWRRLTTIPSVAACTDTALPACGTPGTAAGCLTRLPQKQAEFTQYDNIPLMAFATGSIDALECVMLKIGVASTEFTNPGGGGRINLFVGFRGYDPVAAAATAIGGARIDTNTPTEDALVGDLSTLEQYDMVLFPCEENEIMVGQSVYNQQTNALVGTWASLQTGYQSNVISYANAGGRIFATHYSYIWLYDDTPFSGTADFGPNLTDIWSMTGNPPDQLGYINQTFPKGQALAEWLQNIGASTTQGQIGLNTLRWDIKSVSNDAGTQFGVNPPAQLWMSIDDPYIHNVAMHYTFNTPVGAAATNQCGKVLFDDFHVEAVTTTDASGNAGLDDGIDFPGECPGGVMTPQEKLLEFMIFDLGSCVAPSVPTCTPTTCVALGINCGPAGDGCGNLIAGGCGTCLTGQSCGGGGTPGVCGTPTCTPRSCAALGISCGPAGDGCGNLIAGGCGTCPTGQSCGGGGRAGVCGAGSCTPTTCAAQGIQCGPAGDGCGNSLSCGICPSGQTCGGGGQAGVCGSSCVPMTCVELGFNCGPAGDGCGNQLDCGTCSAPQTCGGGGTAGVCGGNIPK